MKPFAAVAYEQNRPKTAIIMIITRRGAGMPMEQQGDALGDLTVAIVAGGRSTRMGADKALVRLGDRALIEHVAARAALAFPDAPRLVIAGRPDAFAFLRLPCHPDVIPDQGALGGIYTALYHSRTVDTLVVACDMPLIQPDLLRYLAGLRVPEPAGYDVIVPRVDGYPQGLLAIYRRTCLGPVRASLEAGQRRVIGFYDRMRVLTVDEADYAPHDPHGLSFFNVNTPEDLAAARQHLAGGA
jgi:molybdopterin-guanine dinucleotide biosynthesis protein A